MRKWILSVVCILVPLAWCGADDAGVTIVGRGGAAREVGKGGVVREIPKSQLQFRNLSRGAGQAPRVAPPPPDKPATKKDGQQAEAAPAKPAVKELSPEAKARVEAARQANIDQINKVRQLGGWIYDKNDKPLSKEELDRRIKSGDLDDIKTIDIYQEQSKTVSAEDAAKEPPKPGPQTKREER